MSWRKIVISVLSGIVATVLSLYSVKLDNIFGIKLVWSMVFPVLITVVWEMRYAVLTMISGPVFIPFIVGPKRGVVNVMIAALYLVWAFINSGFRCKKTQKPWYYNYKLQTIYSLIYVASGMFLFKELYAMNRYLGGESSNIYISPAYLKVSILNDVFSGYMVIALVMVLLQLPVVRKIYSLEEVGSGEISYRYFGNLVLFIILFSILDTWMDNIYSISRGLRLSFFRISTGENIKISLIIFFSSMVCHYCIVNARIKEKNRIMLANLNNSLEKKVMQRTLDLERAYSDLESFSYTVSHELQNPIRKLEAYIEVIEEDNEMVLAEQSKDDILSMKRICEETITLIKQMMDYSKAGYVGMDIQSINLEELVGSCMDEMSEANEESKVQFVIKELPTVNGDRFLLRQVVFNILSNSYKFTAKIEAPMITVWSEETEEEERIFFRDNGVGFKAAYAHKVFGIFDRLHNENEYEGKGIGLATVKKIMNRHNGDVWIEGEENKGCTVTLIFRKEKEV